MAAAKANETSSMILKVVTGTNEDGTPKTSNRTLSGVNPSATLEQFYSIGTKMGALQSHEVHALVRSDRADIYNEE